MSFDFIDMIVNTGDEFLTGVFYHRRPVSPMDYGVTFRYKQLDPNSKVFDKVLGELRKDSATYAIKTNDDCKFKVGGYIRTQNDLLWEITTVITNEEVEGGNEALRWFKVAKNSEVSIRMVQVDDVWGIDEAYKGRCNITITSKHRIHSIKHDNVEESVDDYSCSYSVLKGKSATFKLYFGTGEEQEYEIPANLTLKDMISYNADKNLFWLNIESEQLMQKVVYGTEKEDIVNGYNYEYCTRKGRAIGLKVYFDPAGVEKINRPKNNTTRDER